MRATEGIEMRLTAKARAALPASAFAGPNRTFPITDPSHAKAALMDLRGTKKLDTAQKRVVRGRARGMLDRVGK